MELREEIQDVLALIENSYLEEQRKNAKLAAEAHEAEARKERAKEKRRFRDNARFEKIVAVLSAFGLPMLMVSGAFGMNLSVRRLLNSELTVQDLPASIPFWPTIAVSLGASLLLLVIFIFLSQSRVSSEEKFLDKYYKSQQNQAQPPPLLMSPNMTHALSVGYRY